ncbi:MAG: hypothetical protein C4K47_02980 [Candidatus Thorarchaeota archaeon]|nr:MAG: hypothetical protein C4K47_02980 [Candidatus Thorarchaeota archaeon]
MPSLRSFKKSIGRLFRQVFHKPKAKISRGSILLVVALTILFFAALAVRLAPMMSSQPVVHEFDCWYQLKVTEYVAANGYASFFSWYDYTSWVPFGRSIPASTYIGVPFTAATLYFIVNGLGISIDVLTVSIMMSSFMGACTTLITFFLGKELSNKAVGLLSSLFMAFMPAYIQRTTAGFFDNESVGIFAIVITLLFFVRALKRGSLPSAVAAGLCLGYLQISWGASDFLTDLFALFGALMLVTGRYSRRLLSSYLITLSIGLFIGGLLPRSSFETSGTLTSLAFLAPVGVGAVLACYEVWLRVARYRHATAGALAPHAKPILLGLVAPIVGVAAYFAYETSQNLSISTVGSNPITFVGGKFLAVINPFFRLEQRIFNSVAEHLPAPWASFYQTLSVLIFLFPLGMYFLFKRGKDEDWLVVLFGLAAVYFTGSMIRLGLILAPAVALLAAVAVDFVLAPFAKVVAQKSVFERRRFRISTSLTSEHALAAFTFVGLLLSVNVYLGIQYGVNMGGPEFAPISIYSTSGQWRDWQTAMTHVRSVMPSGATVASWWDYGYWINGAGGADTVVDNATINGTQIALMGYALMALNLTESLRIFKLWNATQILVYWGHEIAGFGGDDGKWPWMVRIAEDYLGTKTIDDATYLGDDPSTTSIHETDYTLDAFYSSTLFKLLSYGEPTSPDEGNSMGLSSARLSVDEYNGGYMYDSRWIGHMPVDLHGAFTNAYVSSDYGLVKIYDIDYTMYYHYINRTNAQWAPKIGDLTSAKMDGVLSTGEKAFASFDAVLGSGFDAKVYIQGNSSRIYFGVNLPGYQTGNDALGIQIAPLGSVDKSDLRIINYQGHQAYDGHIDYNGDWSYDTGGANATHFATGTNITEFFLPLGASSSEDVTLRPGMNYQIRILFWDGVTSGEPTLASEWRTIWIPVQLY